MHNRRLLWHGSRTTNFAGILSQGLRIAPPEAPVVRAWPGECGVGSAGLCTWLRKELCRCSGEGCPGEQGVLFKAAGVVSAVADRWPDVPLQALGTALRQCLRPHSPSPNPTVVVVRLHLSGVVSGTEEVSQAVLGVLAGMSTCTEWTLATGQAEFPSASTTSQPGNRCGLRCLPRENATINCRVTCWATEEASWTGNWRGSPTPLVLQLRKAEREEVQ